MYAIKRTDFKSVYDEPCPQKSDIPILLDVESFTVVSRSSTGAAERPGCCFASVHGSQYSVPRAIHLQHTFHFSISSCLLLYCLTSSSSVFFNPSELAFRIGTTSSTTRSVNTPLIMRKHFLSPGSGSNVSNTSLATRQYPACKPDSKTYLCSSVSCSTSPILAAMFCSVVL
jgi:hypothetical protein